MADNFECNNMIADMHCGNQTFRVDPKTKVLICLKCRNTTALMSFFADIKKPANATTVDKVPPVPFFDNSLDKEITIEKEVEADESGEGPIEVTKPLEKKKYKMRKKYTEDGE